MVRRALGYIAVPAAVVLTLLAGAFGDDGTGRAPIEAVRLLEGTAVPVARTAMPWQSPTASPTRRPAATARPGPAPTRVVPQAPGPTPAQATSEPEPSLKFVVANTGGDGALLRPEPGGRAMIRGWEDGTPMVQVGPDRVAGGKMWKNVRDPEGNVGWIVGDFLAPAN